MCKKNKYSNRHIVERLREAAENKALDIGTAWNLLNEAAEALDWLETQGNRKIIDGWVCIPTVEWDAIYGKSIR